MMKSPLLRIVATSLLSVSLGITGCAGSAGHGANDATSAKSEGEGHAEVGKAAPDLSIQTLNGKGKFSLESRSGKVVIVDFWATWCEPCKKSFPKLEELSKRVGDKVEIIGVSVDDDKNGILDFAKQTGATFALGWDDGHHIADRWKPGTMPTTFVVDTSGKVRHVHDGFHDGEVKLLEKELTAILEEGPGDTRVAKNDDASSSSKKSSSDDSSTTSTTTADASSTTTKTTSTASSEDTTSEDDPPPPPKKKAGKKKPAAKKKPATKKKKPAAAATDT